MPLQRQEVEFETENNGQSAVACKEVKVETGKQCPNSRGMLRG